MNYTLDTPSTPRMKSSFFWFGLFLCFSCSLASFGYKFWTPNKMFWDENYHIASAYKYNNKIFFMEPHPPLGKLLIAISEKYFELNKSLDTSNFLKVDHIKETPENFSFKALRLPSVISAILASCILYLIFYEILGNGILSFLLSSVFFLDNTILVHSRAAMLEGPQLLLINLSLLIFTKCIFKNNVRLIDWLNFGLTLGLALSIKLNSAIILILLVALACINLKNKGLINSILSISSSMLISLTILIMSCYIHFRISNNVSKKTYEVSSEYLEVLNKRQKDKTAFAIALKEMLAFTGRYNKGVPKLKEDAPKENGSHPVFWPLGKKSISYRWDKTSDGKVKHLKLQCNPVGWFLALSGLFAAFSIINAKRFFGVVVENEKAYRLLEIITFSYLAYMIVMLRIGRVMYLYHYFIPLIFSFIISVAFLKIKFNQKINSKIFMISVLFLAISQTISFFYFSPFTYHLPVSAAEFENRNWLSIWRNELILW